MYIPSCVHQCMSCTTYCCKFLSCSRQRRCCVRDGTWRQGDSSGTAPVWVQSMSGMTRDTPCTVCPLCMCHHCMMPHTPCTHTTSVVISWFWRKSPFLFLWSVSLFVCFFRKKLCAMSNYHHIVFRLQGCISENQSCARILHLIQPETHYMHKFPIP